MGLGKHSVTRIYKYKLGSVSVVSNSSDPRGEKFIQPWMLAVRNKQSRIIWLTIQVKPELCLELPSPVSDKEEYRHSGTGTHSPRSLSNCKSKFLSPLPTKALPLAPSLQPQSQWLFVEPLPVGGAQQSQKSPSCAPLLPAPATMSFPISSYAGRSGLRHHLLRKLSQFHPEASASTHTEQVLASWTSS